MRNRKTLFLDRDGVINVERPKDYVKKPEEFIFIPGVLDALSLLNKYFDHIFIVTNQRGVGIGLMQKETLEEIHRKMIETIESRGGRIDKIYVCTETNSCNINRKPNIGMALQAVEDYPDIMLEESVMVGNSISDMQFGKRLGMRTVLVGNKYTEEEKDKSLIDYEFEDLLTFSKYL